MLTASCVVLAYGVEHGADDEGVAVPAGVEGGADDDGVAEPEAAEEAAARTVYGPRWITSDAAVYGSTRRPCCASSVAWITSDAAAYGSTRRCAS